MLYTLGLFVHSWLRWALLALALAIGLRALRGWRSARPWSPGDERMLRVLRALLQTQVIVGLLHLLWLSPLTRAAWHAGLGGMLEVPGLFFFAIVHPVGMVLGVVVLARGLVGARRRADPRARHRGVALAIGCWLAIVIALIPWPGSPWGRPLARLGGPPTAGVLAAEPPPVYAARCAACHGPAGRGDGPAARSLVPRPRAFDDRAWQGAVTDEHLRRVIVEGGAALGKSPAMPAHPDLAAEDVAALVAFIRASATKAP